MLFRAPQLDTVARETPKYSANSLSFLKFSTCLARFTIPVTSKMYPFYDRLFLM